MLIMYQEKEDPHRIKRRIIIVINQICLITIIMLYKIQMIVKDVKEKKKGLKEYHMVQLIMEMMIKIALSKNVILILVLCKDALVIVREIYMALRIRMSIGIGKQFFYYFWILIYFNIPDLVLWIKLNFSYRFYKLFWFCGLNKLGLVHLVKNLSLILLFLFIKFITILVSKNMKCNDIIFFSFIVII